MNVNSITWSEEEDFQIWYEKNSKKFTKGSELVCDLKEMTSFDNLKLGILVGLKILAKQNKKQFKVINLPKQAEDLINTMKLRGKI